VCIGSRTYVVCCSVLQCVSVCCMHCNVLHVVAMCCSELQCVEVCACGYCVAVCCNVLQCAEVCCR